MIVAATDTVGDCLLVTNKDPVSSQTEEICAELLGDQRKFVNSLRPPIGLSFNLHRVDGRRFMSPTNTLTDMVINMLSGHDPIIAPSPLDRVRSFGSLEDLDLLVNGPEAVFAYDNAGAELQYWLPEIELSVDRGIYISVDAGDGQLALVVYELSNPIGGSFEDHFASDASVIESPDFPVLVFEVEDVFGEVELVAVDGTRFVLVGGYGAGLSHMEAQLVAQFA